MLSPPRPSAAWARAPRCREHAVLLVSIELDEILALADRILVMHGGRIIGKVPQEAPTERALCLMMASVPEPQAILALPRTGLAD